uniref:Uncharacterized protein n=1 Tax=Avena sativa TaxID=4498 RepID=A0ACD5YR17_AVESA
MADLTYFRSRPLRKHAESAELNFHLYMRQRAEGSAEANDCAIYDGTSSDANLVARAQGLHSQSSLVTVNIEFVNERFKGSTLTMVGNHRTQKGEWAIVGGTGEFGFAQGVATREELERSNIRELRIHCVTLNFPKTTKVGMFGGPLGFYQDTPTVPERLVSVTIQCDDVVTSIAFSYIDEDGQLKNAGSWGFDGANSHTIQFAPAETVKKIEGTFDMFEEVTTIITSLSIITVYRRMDLLDK